MKTILFLLMSVCAGVSSAQVPAGEEKILGFMPTKNGLTFQVASGSCTTKNDFDIRVVRSLVRQTSAVRLVRLRADRCLPLLPMGIRIQFSYEEMGLTRGDRFRVENPNGIVEGWMWPEN